MSETEQGRDYPLPDWWPLVEEPPEPAPSPDMILAGDVTESQGAAPTWWWPPAAKKKHEQGARDE
jgi:hypothetical protein